MKITVLTENCAGGKLLAEHGLSYYIEHKDSILLFDTGHSDVFLKNAKLLNINLDHLALIILSHGHWDHGDGLRFLQNKTLLTHPKAFMKRFRKSDHSYIGLCLTKEEAAEKLNLELSAEPVFIAPDLVYLGEIPRENNFESQLTPFQDESGNDDFVPDDSGMAIIHNKELVIISGCAHSGICNTIEYAKKVTGIGKIKAVLGGFHLKEQDRVTMRTIKYMKQENITYIYPSHCTTLPALSAFYETFGIKQVKTGDVIVF